MPCGSHINILMEPKPKEKFDDAKLQDTNGTMLLKKGRPKK